MENSPEFRVYLPILIMMVRDGVHQRRREIPTVSHLSANFGVGGAENSLLSFQIFNSSFRYLFDLLIWVRKVLLDDHLSNIMN